jgi:hypothetical protein
MDSAEGVAKRVQSGREIASGIVETKKEIEGRGTRNRRPVSFESRVSLDLICLKFSDVLNLS